MFSETISKLPVLVLLVQAWAPSWKTQHNPSSFGVLIDGPTHSNNCVILSFGQWGVGWNFSTIHMLFGLNIWRRYILYRAYMPGTSQGGGTHSWNFSTIHMLFGLNIWRRYILYRAYMPGTSQGGGTRGTLQLMREEQCVGPASLWGTRHICPVQDIPPPNI